MSHMNEFAPSGVAAYLNTGSEGLVLRASCNAVQSYWRAKRRGSLGRPDFNSKAQQCRAAVASHLGVGPDTVCLTSTASEGLNLLANSLDWKAGDQVVLTDLEHPTNVLPWLRLKTAGVVTVVVPSSDGKVSVEDIAGKITDRTRLVTVSLVSYKNGFRIRFLSELAWVVHRAGSLLCVDATQGIGRIASDLSDADFVVASGHKWMCGIHGLGVIYARPKFLAQVRPSSLGWYSVMNMFAPGRFSSYELKPSAARLQSGMPNFPALYAL
jgi:cysteine desulfurase / selenocysteine lyase